MNPGIYYGMSNADYHASEGISKSGLDLIASSPAHYYARKLDPKRPPEAEQTIAQQNGEIAHCAILEPVEFAKRFKVGPDATRSTKQWKEFEAMLPDGVSAIKPDQSVAAWRQAESVRRIDDIAKSLSVGSAEVSAYWIDEETGMLCKCRPDFVHDCGDAGVVLIDVKTCGNASPSEFSRMIAKHRYHVQDAYYSEGFEIASGRRVLGFVFAAVEMIYPYAASAIQLDAESREQGRADFRRDLNTYAKCKNSDTWPGYGNEVHIARLPGWAFDQEEELEIGYV